jgi:hypothetical protein
LLLEATIHFVFYQMDLVYLSDRMDMGILGIETNVEYWNSSKLSGVPCVATSILVIDSTIAFLSYPSPTPTLVNDDVRCQPFFS